MNARAGWLAAVVTLDVFGLAGCSCATPDPLLVERACGLWPVAAAGVRTQGAVRIDSAVFSGEFQGVLVARPSPLAVRIQLFPDIGGKALDLAANTAGQHGTMPHTGARLEFPGGPADRLLAMFATTALEIHAPMEPERIRCCTADADRISLELAPRFGASSCAVELHGHTRRYTLCRDGVTWQATATASGDVTIEARGFSLTVHVVSQESVEDLPDSVFQLPAAR